MEKENNHVLFAKNSYEDKTCRYSEYSTTCRIAVLRLCLLFLCLNCQVKCNSIE